MLLAKEIKNAPRTFIIGNGGSAANALHIANDLVSVGVKAQALTADVATLTAAANDYGYETIFARQIRTLGSKGDLLIVLTGGGKSPNIHKALDAAREIGLRTWAITGNYHKEVIRAENILRRGQNMQEAEEAQIKLGHEAMKWLKNSAS